MSDDLIAFLNARLDEDEAAAKAAANNGTGEWTGSDHGYDDGGCVRGSDGEFIVYDEGRPNTAEALHIARHDPARALREVEAKRAIIARYEDCLARQEDDDYPTVAAAEQAREYEDFALPNLAAAWNDHPDYRAEWKP